MNLTLKRVVIFIRIVLGTLNAGNLSFHFQLTNFVAAVSIIHCVSTDASGQVRHWHVSTKQCLSTIHEERHTLAARFAHDHLTFATAGSDSKVHIYDYPTNTLLSVLEPRLDRYTYIHTNIPVRLCMYK